MAGGGVRTVQHLGRRGVRQVFEVCPSRCPRASPLTYARWVLCEARYVFSQWETVLRAAGWGPLGFRSSLADDTDDSPSPGGGAHTQFNYV